ncbi:hypothetical protein [Mesorhizobium sp. WSM2239]
MFETEVKVLRTLAGDDQLDGWGAAVSAALGYLQGSGFATRGSDPQLTDKGKAKLKELGYATPQG